MIWFSSKKLEKALSEGVLSDWEKAKYLVLMAVLSALSGSAYLPRPIYGRRLPAEIRAFYLAFGVIGMLVVYFGIKRCFNTNQKIDAERFFERMACLSVPVSAKMVVFCLPAFLVVLWAAVLLGRSHSEPHEETTNELVVALGCLGPVLLYLYYWMLNRSFARLGALLRGGQE